MDWKKWNGHPSPPDPSCALRRLLRGYGAALAGVAGPILFWSTLTFLGQVQPEYNAFRSDISLLVLGPGGWTQTANFIVFGLSIIVFQRGFQQAIVPRRTWAPMSILALASGLALVAIAIFPTDPPGAWTTRGAVHLGVVAVLASLLPVTFFVTAGEVKRHPSWRGHTGFTALSGILTGILSVMLLLAWSGAWRALHPWLGLLERAVFGVPSVWMGVTGIRLMKTLLGHSKAKRQL
jgi:hypothetical membrane protein